MTGARRGAALVALAALVGVAATAWLLTWRYRPAGLDQGSVPASVRWSDQLVAGQRAAGLASVLAVLAWAALSAWDRTLGPRRRAIGVSAAVVAVALLALTARAWHEVRWDQLALWSVTVGTDPRGVWDLAFSDQVRFAIVDGGEATPSDLAPWVVVHLVAPIAALVVFAVGWLATDPPRRTPRPRPVPPSSDEPFELEVLPGGEA